MNSPFPFTIDNPGSAVKISEAQAAALGITAQTEEIRGDLKHVGPWHIPVSYRAMVESTVSDPVGTVPYKTYSVTFHGVRTMSDCKESGHCLEGRITLDGRKLSAFTSSILVELPDGRLVSIATIFARIPDEDGMDNNAPNLDCETIEDLRELWGRLHKNPRKVGAELFPKRPGGYVRAAKGLAAYAINKATAMDCRFKGEIATALSYEEICDRIYSRLPSWAKW